MRAHTTAFKNKIKEFGRELDSIITYTNNGTTYTLGQENIYSINFIQNTDILKSSMRQLIISCDQTIPIGQVISFSFGIKTRNDEVINYRENYDYINYGNYIVKDIEINEDNKSYRINCYDKMLYSMVDYENSNIAYPITIRDYINEICTKLGLTFKNVNSTFANYDKIITEELYLSYDESTNTYSSLGYKFRDVLDELAEVTASIICINEDDDELEIRYINSTNDTIDEEFLKNINVNFGEEYGPINTIVLSRSAGADNIYYPDPLPQNPVEIIIEDNQIMNGNNRDEFMPDIYAKLNGLQYYLNDFSSIGICYYDVGDKYNIQIGQTTYSCVLFNNEIQITQGLVEDIYTRLLEQSKTDYTNANKSDIAKNIANLEVKKNKGEINALAQRVDNNENVLNSVQLNINSQSAKIDILSKNIDNEGNVTAVKTKTGFTFDENGLNISNSQTGYNAQHTNTSTQYRDGTTVITETSKDGFITTDLKEKGTHKYNFNGSDYDFVAERIDIGLEHPYAHFYNGN